MTPADPAVLTYNGSQDALRWGFLTLGRFRKFRYHWDRLARRVRLWPAGFTRPEAEERSPNHREELRLATELTDPELVDAARALIERYEAWR